LVSFLLGHYGLVVPQQTPNESKTNKQAEALRANIRIGVDYLNLIRHTHALGELIPSVKVNVMEVF